MIRLDSTALVHSNRDGWREVNMPPAIQRPIPGHVRGWLPCVANVLAGVS